MDASDGKLDKAYLLYRGGAAVTSALPEGLLFAAAYLLGTAIAKVNKPRRDVVRRNLVRVVDGVGIERVVDEAFRSYARYWVETLRIPKPGTAEIKRRTSVEGMDELRACVSDGRGVIFVTPHVGSWDVAGAWLASEGFRVIAVAEELEPPALFELFRRLRRSVGVEVHPVGTASSARALLSGLREGAAIGLVADRDITGSGVMVEFFGEQTMVPTGPAVLAMRTGAPIAVGALYQRPGGRYHGVILPPIEVPKRKGDASDVRRLTERVVAGLETLIRREPGQWHLFQPNWPSDPGYRHAE